jgi:hypothetical protein
VTLVTSGGTSQFANNHEVIFCVVSSLNGTNGTSGVNGTSGSSGTTGTSGTSGTSGTTGTSGTSGSGGTSGTTAPYCWVVIITGLPGGGSYDAWDCTGTVHYTGTLAEGETFTNCIILGNPSKPLDGLNVNFSYPSPCSGSAGTSGSSGYTCSSYTITVEWLSGGCPPGDFRYKDCDGNDVIITVPESGIHTYNFCCIGEPDTAHLVPECWNVTVDYNGVCTGSAGTSGTSGTGGGGTNSCGDIVKIAAVSGTFEVDSPKSPNLLEMFIGNVNVGWSLGLYDDTGLSDNFGNLVQIRPWQLNSLIPLPADFLVGDVIKICGVVYSDYLITGAIEPPGPSADFYITVSSVTCDGLRGDDRIPLSTLISPTSFPINLGNSFTRGEYSFACFSTSVTLTRQLPGCTTYLLVGVNTGTDFNGNTFNQKIKFSYTLDGIKYCASGANLRIRNCCEPIYSEVIANNGVAVGQSFSDIDGNCWTVVAETTDNITGTRNLDMAYASCALCIADYHCPLNFRVESCCFDSEQVFAATTPGINVGDSFVDSNGICWTVFDTTSVPSTYLPTINTIYTGEICEFCVESNACPTFYLLNSCCDLGQGYTTDAALSSGGITPIIGECIVDQYGFCWRVEEMIKDPLNLYPNLGFLVATSTDYSCFDCTNSNPCPATLFYTLRNCCDELIHVVELNAIYGIDMQLVIVAAEEAGCFTVEGWNTTGVATLTSVSVEGVDGPFIGPQKLKSCQDCIVGTQIPCIGQQQCCTTLIAVQDGSLFTGYLCDGTYQYQQVYNTNDTVCAAWIDRKVAEYLGWQEQNLCCFQVYNPSNTNSIWVTFTECETVDPPYPQPYELLPGDATPCVYCVRIDDELTNPSDFFVYVDPNTCPPGPPVGRLPGRLPGEGIRQQ